MFTVLCLAYTCRGLSTPMRTTVDYSQLPLAKKKAPKYLQMHFKALTPSTADMLHYFFSHTWHLLFWHYKLNTSVNSSSWNLMQRKTQPLMEFWHFLSRCHRTPLLSFWLNEVVTARTDALSVLRLTAGGETPKINTDSLSSRLNHCLSTVSLTLRFPFLPSTLVSLSHPFLLLVNSSCTQLISLPIHLCVCVC